ncbi:MAG TPA: hypothetical protein VNT51_10960 [Miltoncostaeaceae bacterium]|nr:hypothetical protein [Miltoncostaeaceae bacterium]
MNVGEPIRTVVVEPIVDPVPAPAPAPAREREPEPASGAGRRS